MSKTGPLWRSVQQRLEAAALAPAPREGRVLVAHVLGLSQPELLLEEQHLFPEEKKDILETMVQRRLRGEPLAYITGRAPFWHHDWRVGPGVLIPRPDSEILLRAVLAELETLSATHTGPTPLRFAEIGIGSGALTGSILQETPEALAVATDISSIALETARLNLHDLGLLDRCRVVETDILHGVDGPFDLIFSNPPYIAAAEWAALEPGVRDFEPREALVADQDGLAVYARLIVQAAAKLRPGGALCLEIGWQQAQPVTALLQQQKDTGTPWTDIQVLQDLARRDRVVCARLP